MSGPWEDYKPQAAQEKGPWEDYAQKPEEPSFGSKVLDGVVQVGRAIDSYTTAPAKAAIGRIQDGGGIFDSAQAFSNQFGEHPEFAPTGKQIAQKAGITDQTFRQMFPSVSDNMVDSALGAINPAFAIASKYGKPQDIETSSIAGFGIDVGADPTLLIPANKIAQGIRLGANAAKEIKFGSKIAQKMLDGASNVLAKTTTKVGSTLTGVPEKNIETYIKNTSEIDEIIKATNGDVSLAADELRTNLQSAIQNKIAGLGSDIKTAIQSSPAGSVESNGAIVGALQNIKQGINPGTYPEAISEIDDLIAKVGTIGKDGKLDAAAANEAKLFLQDMAKGSYQKGGQLFSLGDKSQKAAKVGASQARKIEMQLAPGTIAPNKELSALHRYEKNVNKNLIAPGKTEAALMAAGSGQNLRNTKNLKDISNMTGFDAIGEAEKLSAAKMFGESSYLPVDATGKSFTRVAVASGIGSLIGGPIGAALSVGATSPVVLRQAIRSGKMSKDLVMKLARATGELTDDVLIKASKMANTEEGLAILRAAAGTQAGFKQASMQAENKKGVDRWIAKGQERLLESDSSIDREFLEQIKKDKKFRDKLIRAGELKPKSAQLNQLLEQIKTSEEYKKHLKQKEKSAQGKEPDQSSAKPQMKFPQVLQKDGFTAVVRNMSELDEARSEGWA